jgi:hypothetical protein
MKFLITESKMEQVVFNYLDNKDFIKIEKGDYIYFFNSADDTYAQIKYDEKDGWCYIDFGLNKEISSFFSLERSDSEKVIGLWIENTIQMKVTHTGLRGKNRD